MRYLNNNRYGDALDELKRYQKEALRLNDSYGIGNAYVELGNLYLSQGLEYSLIYFPHWNHKI